MGQIDHFRENVIRELIPFRCYIGNIGTNATLIDHFEVVGTLIAKSACSLGGQWLWSIPWLDCLKISHLSAYMAKLYYDHQSRHLWMWEIGWKVNSRSFRISHDSGLPSSFGRIMRLKCTKNSKIGNFFQFNSWICNLTQIPLPWVIKIWYIFKVSYPALEKIIKYWACVGCFKWYMLLIDSGPLPNWGVQKTALSYIHHRYCLFLGTHKPIYDMEWNHGNAPFTLCHALICQLTGWLYRTCEWHDSMMSIKMCYFWDDQCLFLHDWHCKKRMEPAKHDWNL